MKYISKDLEELRKNNSNYRPFEAQRHQRCALEKLAKTFDFPINKYKGGLLVFPTGAGKTYTAVNWICNNVIPQNTKVLWLAHASHLLEQACETFVNNLIMIPTTRRKTVNIRVVSSNPSHSSSGSIDTTDDILIITTETAIINFNAKPLNQFGNVARTPFQKFIEYSKTTGLLIVLDEAHHAPAYGCRNLLIGNNKQSDEKKFGIRDIVPNTYILGLTATPTYLDEKNRGWLSVIFDNWIIADAKFTELNIEGILATPKYLPKPTGKELAVDDRLFDRLVREHRDLPEDIIDKLAEDSARNDYIVNEYVENKDIYSKTIIFADRWFQCVYLKDKLVAKGIKADAVYSHIDADPGSAEARNKRKASENGEIIEKFKNNEIDVLINVRMLTEGTDVPDVKTVFVTRQTTSSILLTQMIGRALRGEKAGGGKDKKEANIVLFIDDWKRILNFATPSAMGGVEDQKPLTFSYPIKYISICLIERLVKQINSGIGYAPTPFLEIVPIGWYKTEITVDTSENGNYVMQDIPEYVMVYDSTKLKFEKFIAEIKDKLQDEWGEPKLEQKWMQPQVEKWIKQYFNVESDDIGNTLDTDLIKIARHISKYGTLPEFHYFTERENHDLDKLAKELMCKNDFVQYEFLQEEFNKSGRLWKDLYKDFYRFKTAFDSSKNRLIAIQYGNNDKLRLDFVQNTENKPRELLETEKEQVFVRDGYKCLCCGIQKGRGVKLVVDHILPVVLQGSTSIENSQTLCGICNSRKGINEINFRDKHNSPLTITKELELFKRNKNEDPEHSLKRIVNFFYHCQAVVRINKSERSNGKFYKIWVVELYSGNNPDWLNQYKEKLIKYIHNDLKCVQVTDIQIIGTK